MRISPPRLISIALLAGTVTLAACRIDTTSVCFEGCRTGPLQATLWAVGFPQGRVDHSSVAPSGYYRGTLPVGQSVTLVQVLTAVPGGIFSTDTVRQVTWQLSDTTVARIDVQPGGGGRITGRAPGVVGQVLANGAPMVVWSCPVERGYCERLDAIVITP